MRWLWRTSRIRMLVKYWQDKMCLADCGSGHTYGAGCLLSSRSQKKRMVNNNRARTRAGE